MTLKYTNKNTMMPLTRDTVFVNNKREEACQAKEEIRATIFNMFVEYTVQPTRFVVR